MKDNCLKMFIRVFSISLGYKCPRSGTGIFLALLLLCSCARPTFRYNEGQLVKYKRPPMGNKYKMAFVVGFGLDSYYQRPNR